MSATSRLKQLLFIVAGLALVVVGLSGLATAAQAEDTQPCVPTEDQFVTQFFESDPGAPWVATGNSRVKTPGTAASLTDWVNDGDAVRTEENVAPTDPDGTDESSLTNLIRYVFVGQTDPEVVTPATPGAHYSWNGGNRGVNDPPTVVPPHADWQANTDGEPAGHLNSATWYPLGSATPGVGLHVVGNSPTNASWFYSVAGSPAVTDVDYLWQKQVRSVVPGTDAVLEYEYTMTIEGVDCPDEEPEGKKVVVCKYVGTPPGTPDHIIVVSVASLGDGFTGTFPYAFGDAQDSIAIRFAVGNEQPGDEELANCPVEEPEECPEGDHNGDAEGCEEEPEECPDGDHNGEAEGCEEDDDEEECPPGSDNEGTLIKEGENADDVCDDDPIIGPGEGENPGNNPGTNPGNNSNNPGNSPAGNPQGSNQPNNPVAPASAPVADVPSAVNAGLLPTQRELGGAGDGLGLIGVGTALIGVGLLGLTLRPRRGRKLTG